MMAKGYVTQMTHISEEILAQGRLDAGAKISAQMLKEGNMDFVKVWNEARKAHGGEDATDDDPKSIKDQLKEAVGSVSSNAKSKLHRTSAAVLYTPVFMCAPQDCVAFACYNTYIYVFSLNDELSVTCYSLRAVHCRLRSGG